MNGNNKFDAVWITGFQINGTFGVKDDLMVITAVIDDGQTRIRIISAAYRANEKFVLSVHEDVLKCGTSWCMPLTIMRSRYQGLWGPSFFKSVDEGYMEQLKTAHKFIKVAIDNGACRNESDVIPTNLTPILRQKKTYRIDDDIK